MIAKTFPTFTPSGRYQAVFTNSFWLNEQMAVIELRLEKGFRLFVPIKPGSSQAKNFCKALRVKRVFSSAIRNR